MFHFEGEDRCCEGEGWGKEEEGEDRDVAERPEEVYEEHEHEDPRNGTTGSKDACDNFSAEDEDDEQERNNQTTKVFPTQDTS